MEAGFDLGNGFIVPSWDPSGIFGRMNTRPGLHLPVESHADPIQPQWGAHFGSWHSLQPSSAQALGTLALSSFASWGPRLLTAQSLVWNLDMALPLSS